MELTPVIKLRGIAFAGCLLLPCSCSSLQDSGLQDSGSQDPAAEQGPTVPIVIADPLTDTLALYLGGRVFNEDLDPAEGHSLVGVEYTTQAPGAAVGWEFGIQLSEDVRSDFDFSFFGGTTLEASSLEFYGGVRKTFNETGALRPYVGGGLSLLTVELDFGSQSDDAAVLGFYLHAGAALYFNQTFALALDYRVLAADDADLFGIDTDVDYGQLALILSFRF